MAVCVSQQNPHPVAWSVSPALINPADVIMPTAVGGPHPLESRQGRHMQRYGAEGERLVAGCIPVRFSSTSGRMEDVEVLMISSSGGKGFVFPKGGWEDDETVETAALRETVEEAGVRGTLEEPVLGLFTFASAKSDRQDKAHARCTAHMYVMHVAEVLEEWPEGLQRDRVWVSLPEASANCRHQWMREALHAWILRRGWDVPPPASPAAAPRGASALPPSPACTASPM